MSYTPDPKGFYQKYIVTRPETGKPVSDCFVLRIHDPHAREALAAYADSVEAENSILAADIRAWIESYEGDL